MNTILRLLPLATGLCLPVASAQGDPTASASWHLTRLVDEHGHLDPQARAAALAERLANVEHWASRDGGGIGRYGWTERGPANLAGRTRAIVQHPAAEARLYAATAGGGIWRSNDYGDTWTPLDDWMQLDVTCLTIDPNATETLYAGTGVTFVGRNGTIGGGIWRSTDGGDHWAQLASTTGWPVVHRIAVPWTNSNVLVAATETGIRRSSNGGTTWTTVRTGMATQVAVDPVDGTRMVAHVDIGTQFLRDHRVFYSTNTGGSWTAGTGGYAIDARIELAYSRSPGVVYASLGDGQCWRSSNGGASWTQRSVVPIADGDLWDYHNSIWVDPTNANNLWIGAVNVWRSLDGGQTFTRVSAGGINTTQPHPGVHSIVGSPAYNGTTIRVAYIATDGGIWRTGDIQSASTTSNWSRRDQNCRTVHYHAVAGTGAGLLVGGSLDQATHVLPIGSNQASVRLTGDGGFVAIDPTDANYVYAATANLQIQRSTNGGTTFAPMTNGLSDAGSCANYIAPFVLAPGNANLMFAGGCSVWRCLNAKAATPTWGQMRPPVGPRVSAIAVSPLDANVVWVGYSDGTVALTTTALSSGTWTTIDDNVAFDPLPDRAVTRILADRTSTQGALVAFGGFSSDNLYRTTDRGVSWTDATGTSPVGLPTAPIYGIAQHPSLVGRYYVATEVGVFGTDDTFASWSTTNDGPSAASCSDLTFLHGSSTLLVGTYGRGLWTSHLFEPGVAALGAGCAGTVGTPMLAATAPRLGFDVELSATNLVAGTQVWLLHGASSSSWLGSSLPFDLLPFGAGGCRLRVSADIVHGGLATGAGTWTASLPIAPHPVLLGRQFHLQLFPGDAAANSFGLSSSNALSLTIGN